ncbi:MAG TPA: ATP-binding protein [Chthonomonadaceae bacterium]|nr:ATP-binding protein [Chthonomonadaceae bacterium]
MNPKFQEDVNVLAAATEIDYQIKNAILEIIPSVLIALDTNARVTIWNPAAERAFGIPARDVLGKPIAQCSIRWDSSRVLPCLEEQKRSLQLQMLENVKYTRGDGADRLLGITLIPILGAEGTWMGVLLLAADVTERKLLESQLAHAQKMESIGQLAAGIAHEINTPTQYIGDNVCFLQEAFALFSRLLKGHMQLIQACKAGAVSPALLAALEADVEHADVEYLLADVPKAIQQSLEGIARVSKIVQAMKEFSHPGTEEKVGVDINRAIESTLMVARNEWKYVAEAVTDFDPSLPMVPCLPGELNQVFLNIIINAAHAIADVVGDGSLQKGQIKISTRHKGNWVEIRISDTGGGIPEAVRSRVFDPFFTTKEVGKGTGQGLAIAHSTIVDKHKGAISFETEVGKGTTFIIRLPLTERHERKAHAA